MRLEGSEVTSANIGLAVLRQLRTVDEVAYLRFASVYKNFDAAADFHRELELMEKETASPDQLRRRRHRLNTKLCSSTTSCARS